MILQPSTAAAAAAAGWDTQAWLGVRLCSTVVR
jgi:hypothetical protein